MAQFKGDASFTPFYDDEYYNSAESTDEEERSHDPSRQRREWTNEHHEVLSELYSAFKANGVTVFGRVFFQFGNFVDFTDLAYEKTMAFDADLLKSKITTQHVGNMGVGTGSKHWISRMEEGKGHWASGSGDKGV